MPKNNIPMKKAKKELEKELGCPIEEVPCYSDDDYKFAHIETGLTEIKELVKNIKKPADKNSLKEIKESIKLLEKKIKLMKKNDALKAQFIDRTMYDVVNGVFQAFHLYIISTDGQDDDVICFNVLGWLRSHETAYEIADRIQKAAEARMEFSNGKGKK